MAGGWGLAAERVGFGLMGLFSGTVDRFFRLLGAVPQRLHHPLFGAILGPGGALGRGFIRFPPGVEPLRTQEQAQRALRLAHHAGGLGGVKPSGILGDAGGACVLEAFHRMRIGGDILRGERRLRGIGRA